MQIQGKQDTVRPDGHGDQRRESGDERDGRRVVPVAGRERGDDTGIDTKWPVYPADYLT